MPKTKLDRPKVSVWEAYRGLVLSRMVEYGLDIAALSRKMDISPPTMRKYIANPGAMPMDSMRKLNRALDLTAEAARAALAVK